MNRKEYKITRINEWRNFKSILTYIVVFLVLTPILFHYRFPDEEIANVIPISIFGFLAFLMPVIIIHLKYYSINDGLIMFYDNFNRDVTIRNKNGIESNFSIDYIDSIYHYLTGPLLERRMHWWPWDGYNYSIIYLTDGRKFLITSLMVTRLELPVGNKYIMVKTFYPYPKG